MIAADIMTTNVVTTTPETRIEDCAKLMMDHGISALPVLAPDGTLAGIVSEGDLLHRAEIGTDSVHRSWWLEMVRTRMEKAEDYVRSHSKAVGDLMTKKVLTVSPETSVGDIATLLETKHIKRLPVVDGGRVVGIVSRANLVQALAARRADPPAENVLDDRKIREALLSALAKEKWADTTRSNVIVTNGVVEFYGVVDSDSERRAARIAAEAVPGVRAVTDHRMLTSELPTSI